MAKTKEPEKKNVVPGSWRGITKEAPVVPTQPVTSVKPVGEVVKVRVERESNFLKILNYLLVLALIIVVLLLVLTGVTSQENVGGSNVVSITGSYVGMINGIVWGRWTPDRIVVKKGERVTLAVSSLDGGHSFSIPELGIQSPVIGPGETWRVSLVPKKTGTFYYTGRLSYMIGELVVLER